MTKLVLITGTNDVLYNLNDVFSE